MSDKAKEIVGSSKFTLSFILSFIGYNVLISIILAIIIIPIEVILEAKGINININSTVAIVVSMIEFVLTTIGVAYITTLMVFKNKNLLKQDLKKVIGNICIFVIILSILNAWYDYSNLVKSLEESFAVNTIIAGEEYANTVIKQQVEKVVIPIVAVRFLILNAMTIFIYKWIKNRTIEEEYKEQEESTI